jgi:hypothetical protein
VGQEAAAAFAPEDELPLAEVVDDEEVVDEDVLPLLEDEELSDEELDDVVVLSAFLAGASPGFSALTLPDRESLR